MKKKLQSLHQESFRLAKSFIDENPVLVKKYVDTSLATLNFLLSPVDIFMRHLLKIQGLNPDNYPATPSNELNSIFEPHSQDYDDDFNWTQKKFEETRKKINSIKDSRSLSKEQFVKLTDLTHLPTKSSIFGNAQIGKEVKTALETLANLGTAKFDPVTDFQDAIDALKRGVDYLAKSSDDPKKKDKSFKRTPKITKTSDKGPVSSDSRLGSFSAPATRLTNKTQAEADSIQNLIAKGKLNVEDLDELVNHGLSKDSIDLWRKIYTPSITENPDSESKFKGSFKRIK